MVHSKSAEKNLQNKHFDRILMIRLSAVGDVVRTLPALAVLRNNFPEAKIAWLVEEKASEILFGQPELDEVIVFPRRAWKEAFLKGNWWVIAREGVRFAKKLRKARFDLVIDFHGIFKSGLISRMTGAAIRVGFAKGFCKEWNYFFNNRRVSLRKREISRFVRNLCLLEGVGIDTDGCNACLYVSSQDRTYAINFLKKHGLLGRSPLIAVNPGGSEKPAYKRWFPERYAKVADILVKELGASIIIIWGPGERGTAERVHSLMKSPAVVSCPTSLKQLAGLYQHCHLYVGGDTGPMHIASLMGVPVVVIYGPTDPVANAPYDGIPSVQVQKRVSCNPCRERSCQKLDCLRAISHEQVVEAALTLFKG